MDLYERYLHHAYIAEILNVASSLEQDKMYKREDAVKDLVKLVDSMGNDQ